MPSRSYDQPDTIVSVNHTYTHIYGPDPPNSWSEQKTTKMKKGWYSGSTTPEFHKAQKNGELLPHNAYQRFDATVNSPHGIYRGRYARYSGATLEKSYDYSVNSVRSVPNATTSLGTAEGIVTELVKGVDTNALLQAATANAAPELDAGTMLAEIQKTVSLLTGARKRAAGFISDARKLNKQSLKATADAWLEWRYGWRILGYDIQSIVGFMDHPFRDEFAEGRAGTSIDDSSTENFPFTGYYVSHDYIETIKRSVSVRASVTVKYSNSSTNALVSMPITAWELVPFSFIADWFVSVGPAIGAWQVLQNASGFSGSISTKLTETGSAVVSGVGPGSGANATMPYASGGGTSSATLLTRSPASRPSLTPQLVVSLDPAKIVDIIALFASRID